MSTDYEKQNTEERQQLEDRIKNRKKKREKEIFEEKEREELERENIKKGFEEYEKKQLERKKASKKEYVPDSVVKQFAGFFLFLGIVSFFFIPFLTVLSLFIAGVLYFVDYNNRKNFIEHVKEKAISAVDEVKEKTLSVVQNKEEPNPDELLKWHDLKEKGVITEEEFEVHKKRILK